MKFHVKLSVCKFPLPFKSWMTEWIFNFFRKDRSLCGRGMRDPSILKTKCSLYKTWNLKVYNLPQFFGFGCRKRPLRPVRTLGTSSIRFQDPSPPLLSILFMNTESFAKLLLFIFIILGIRRFRQFLGRALRLGQAKGPGAASTDYFYSCYI